MKVVISCSGKFHAFALAEQLEKNGMLDTLYTAYSSIKNPVAKLLVSRRDKEKINKNKISTCLPIAFGMKLYKNPFFWNDLFDMWVAFNIRRSDASVFIGWSGMSLHSLNAAKKKGMIVILERGSSHIQLQQQILNEEYKNFGINFQIHKKTIAKELIEYSVSDYISIPSIFVQDSFLEYGIDRSKLILNNYGVGGYFIKREVDKNDLFTVLYLGKLSIQKGLIYLFDAILSLTKKGYNIKCLFVGTIDLDFEPTVQSYRDNSLVFIGQRDHYSLSDIISGCDIAVQPSLQDGFGMVVPQILACGVPVIVSENTGAADIIEDDKNGYIVPIRNSKAIADRIEFLYLNSEKLAEMKQNVLSNPLDLSWDAYGDRYVDFLSKNV